MTQPFPHRYETALTWKGGDRGEIAAGPRPVIAGGPPPEFAGTDPALWSPEHLILAALSQCFLLTWLALNKRSAIELKSWASTSESVLDKTATGVAFTSFKLKVRVEVPAARLEETRKLLETTKKYCIVANSLKTPVELEAEVLAV